MTVSADIGAVREGVCYARASRDKRCESWHEVRAMPPWPGPGEMVFIFMMLVFVLVGEKLPRIADALGKALRGPK